MKLYKLTDENARTLGGMPWGPGITNKARDGEPVLCTDTVLHAYTDPLLAVLLAPLHVSWIKMRLWEAEGDVVVREHDLKVGCKTLTTVRETPLPEITTEQRVKFALLCALEVYDDPAFCAWARFWISGEDRSAEAARAAAWAAEAAWAAAWAAAEAAAWEAAWAAAEAAARAAAEAAEAAAWAAAEAAAEAAARAAEAAAPLDLAALAIKAIEKTSKESADALPSGEK